MLNIFLESLQTNATETRKHKLLLLDLKEFLFQSYPSVALTELSHVTCALSADRVLLSDFSHLTEIIFWPLNFAVFTSSTVSTIFLGFPYQCFYNLTGYFKNCVILTTS